VKCCLVALLGVFVLGGLSITPADAVTPVTTGHGGSNYDFYQVDSQVDANGKVTCVRRSRPRSCFPRAVIICPTRSWGCWKAWAY
jgi:hypothetical protein